MNNTHEEGIFTVPITSVKLWKDNPRNNDKAVPRLQELIRAYGQRGTITVYTKNNVVYKGNTTLKAMKAGGEKEIRVEYVNFKSETAAIAYGISDNKSGEWSEWDDPILTRLMNAPEMKNEVTGFSVTGSKMFEVRLTAEIEAGINDVLNVKRLFPSGSVLRILDYGIVKDGRLMITDLENYFSVNTGVSGEMLVDMQLLFALKSVKAAAVSDPETKDFPGVPDVSFDQKFVKIEKDVFDKMDSLAKFTADDSVRASLTILRCVCIKDGIVFATDGYVACSRETDCKQPIALSRTTAGIISLLFDRITAFTMEKDGKWLLAKGDGFSFVFKNQVAGAEEIPDIRKIAPEGVFTPLSAPLKSILDQILPVVVQEKHGNCVRIVPKYVSYSKEGGGRNFIIKKDTGFTGEKAFNINKILLCLSVLGEKIEMCEQESSIVALQFSDGTLKTLVMPWRVEKEDKKPDYVDITYIEHDDSESRISFQYETGGGTVRGLVKGITESGCKNFINKNFPGAKIELR